MTGPARFLLLLPLAAALISTLAAQPRQPEKFIHFHLVQEPREGAFTMLVPDGWSTQGGVYRVDPSRAGGAGNSVSAKVDFIVARDPSGSTMTHRLPDMLYKDMRRSPADGMFPQGSNYNGMVVSPPMDPATYLLNVVFRQSRPQARNVQVVARVPLPAVARSYEQIDRSMGLPADFRHSTGMVFVNYDEGAAHFTEVLYTDIQLWGMGTDMWGNKDTYTARAPADEFLRLCPAFKLMNDSTRLNPQWIMRELQSQASRNAVVADVQQHNQQIESEMVRHRQATNAEINNQIQLLLADKTTEINPHTGKKEIVPIYSQSGAQGSVFYGRDGTAVLATDPAWDPEKDPQFANKGYKLGTPR